MRRHRPPVFCLGALAAAALVGGGYLGNVRLNTTGSMPIGLWRLAPVTGPLKAGQIVSVCLPAETARDAMERGYIGGGECPDNSEALIKRAVAVAGDVVTVSSSGLSVNGQLIDGTAPLANDTAGRPLGHMPPGEYSVFPGSVWVVTNHPRSWDSRYFGAVSLRSVTGIAEPLIVIP